MVYFYIRLGIEFSFKRIPSGGDVELVVYPELLAQNWMLNSQISIGEVEKIAECEALRLDIFPSEASKDKLRYLLKLSSFFNPASTYHAAV
ncbi:hypothetical protein [Desulfotruncus arcticus]|uniref:hypothetical protein n=1 Tax=Desulfotruncus arcticus TaxID=341036 RepID=UPI0010425295|nr:hypothetical protein [Desulfotruncus arcticus]